MTLLATTTNPAAGPADDTPAVDAAVLDTLVAQLDPQRSGLREVLVSSYLEDGAAQVTRLLMAVNSANLAEVASVSHTLRSTSALLGAGRLAALLLSAEEAAKADPGSLPQISVRIGAEHARVAECLTRMIRPTPSAALR